MVWGNGGWGTRWEWRAEEKEEKRVAWWLALVQPGQSKKKKKTLPLPPASLHPHLRLNIKASITSSCVSLRLTVNTHCPRCRPVWARCSVRHICSHTPPFTLFMHLTLHFGHLLPLSRSVFALGRRSLFLAGLHWEQGHWLCPLQQPCLWRRFWVRTCWNRTITVFSNVTPRLKDHTSPCCVYSGGVIDLLLC